MQLVCQVGFGREMLEIQMFAELAPVWPQRPRAQIDAIRT